MQTNNFMLLMKTSFSRFQNNHAELSEYSFTLLYINAIFSVQKYSKWMKMLYWNFLPIFVWYINFLINTLRHLSLCNIMQFLNINFAVDTIYFDIDKNEFLEYRYYNARLTIPLHSYFSGHSLGIYLHVHW